MERIIFNLLSNAFKFTPGGGTVTVDIDVYQDANSHAILVLAITDTGVGIEEQNIDKIFDRFYQQTSSDAILNHGTGIGLAITREYVELHKGKIWAEGKSEKGAKFFVEIPLISDNKHQNIANQEINHLPKPVIELPSVNANKVPSSLAEKAIILVVEDNDEFRNYLSEHLQEFYHVVKAVDGKEGWQKVLSSHPQLVISDINMPFMSGVELSKKIKGDKRTRQIPVILLTAHAGEERQLEGLKSGASDFLPKPFSFQILNTKIENLLDLTQNLKDTYSKQIHITDSPVEIASSDMVLLDAVRKYIEEKLSHSDLSVEDLSKSVGMSRGSLYYKLIELTGLSPVEYIRSIKLDKAAKLLESDRYNVAQAAYMTGFATPSYFSKIFKEKFGIPPSEYLQLKKRDAKV
jgi:DNA-binding response OmpR family regulator